MDAAFPSFGTGQPTATWRPPISFVPPSAAPFVERRTKQPSRWVNVTCRAVNVVAALVLLILGLPVMLAVAVAVRLSSEGPILYRQPRVGVERRKGGDRRADRGSPGRRVQDAGGRVFTIYKFRTMVDRPAEAAQVWASEHDPRITRVGGFLRKTRLDELPQLWNVIKGDMNLVGPRPEQPSIFRELRTALPEYPRRQAILPGITGWAQVNLPYDQCLDDVRRKVEFDLEYIERRTPIQDLKIMALTLPVLVSRRGAL